MASVAHSGRRSDFSEQDRGYTTKPAEMLKLAKWACVKGMVSHSGRALGTMIILTTRADVIYNI